MAPIGFRHHLGLKFLSLALAALLWLVVSGEQVAERVLRVPLEFTNLPSALELVGDAPGQVDVRVRGSSGAVSRINPGDLVAVVDLRSARPGRRLFHVADDDVRRPFGVDVVQVNPGSVAITFEKSSAKVVPVVPGIDGEPAPGFAVGAVTSEPSTVEVVGPESALKRLTEAITEPVSVDGATAPRNELVTVGLADPLLRLRSPQSARVFVTITPAPIEWSVPQVPVKIRNGRPGAQVQPAQVTVHAKGARERAQADASAFEAFVDTAGLRPGQFTLPVRIVSPEGVGVTAVEPAQVRVRLR
jgi:YbbR domain-containing protein